MTTEIYAFKIRRAGDLRNWDDIPQQDEWPWPLTPDQALGRASFIASHEAVEEVRYNISGSTQGHYVTGKGGFSHD